MTAYLDASAMVKLIVEEPDSPAMYRWYIEHAEFVTSRVGMIETRRAARRRNHDPAYLASILRSISAVELDRDIAERAASAARLRYARSTPSTSRPPWRSGRNSMRS